MTVAGTHEMAVGTTPGAAATGKLRIYPSSVDNLWHQVDESNVDSVLSGTPGADVSYVVTAHGSMGSTETFDYGSDATPNHSGTLTAACTFTFTNPVATGNLSILTLFLEVDSGGPWGVTLPASVTNKTEAEAFLSAVPASGSVIIAFTSIDGGTNWTADLPSGGTLDAVLADSSGEDIADALTGANAPTAGNVFATIADVSPTTPAYVGAKAYNSTTQSISGTAMFAFDSEEWDTSTFHDNSTNNSRFTCSTAGYYLVQGGSFAGAAVDWIACYINGSIVRGTATFARAGASYFSASWIVHVTAGQYIEIGVATTGSVTFGHASLVDAQTWGAVTLIGS